MTFQYDDAIFRALMLGSPVPSAVNDSNGNITYLNEAFINSLGYVPSDIPTLEAWWPLAYPDPVYREQVRENWNVRLKESKTTGQSFVPLEVNIRIKSGEIHTFIASASEMPDKANKLHLVTLIDITDRKKAELALQESEERLNLALSGAEMSMWDFNVITGKIGLCERWYRLLGYENGAFQLDTKNWRDFVYSDDWQPAKLNYTRHINGETANFEAEFRVLHKDGHWVWIQSRGKVVERDRNGKALRIAGINFDISNRKRLATEGTELLQKIEALILGLGANQSIESTNLTVNQLNQLTSRQKKVLELIALGLTSAQIAGQLGISLATAVTHRRNLMKRLDLHSTAEVTRFAIQHKLISD